MDTAATGTKPVYANGEQVRHQNPEQVLRYAYCLHVADDSHTKDKLRQEAAAKEARDFLSMKAEPNTPADSYLKVAITIAISYAGMINGYKNGLHKELDAAEAERDAAYKKIRGGRGWSIVSAVVMRNLMQAGMAGVVFGLGFSLAHTVAPFVPDDFAQGTGKTAPSFLTGFVFVILARFIAAWLDDKRRNFIANRYAVRVYNAWDFFGEMRISAYTHHYSDLREAWKRFTGVEYQTASVLIDVMVGDLNIRREHQMKVDGLSSKGLNEILKVYNQWRARKRVQTTGS